VLTLVGARGADRRFTGSHERGSFEPAAMPVTSWFDDDVQRIEPMSWSVAIDGVAYSLQDLELRPDEHVSAVLDCTSGWYSRQEWSGVRLDRLIRTDAPAVLVRSATGYTRRFPTRDLDRLWLVTSVGGRPLSAGHGFPARIVAPGRRGFWWVKWVVAIEPSPRPWWIQLPFPAT
jgi:DMSO/TMAO reductase YedYZ molybdopterin-dependent catalytic subunit